jgi:hypothetical protein
MGQMRPRWREVFGVDLPFNRFASSVTQKGINEAIEQYKPLKEELRLTYDTHIRRSVLWLNQTLFITSSGYLGWGPL